VEPEEHLAALEDAAGRLLAVAAGSLDRPVPSCPEWHVADLVAHVGRVWDWAATIVELGEPAERPDSPDDLDQGPFLAWAAEQAGRITGVLGTAVPDSSCWTFGPPPTRRFWFRRQALETSLHAWDAETAAGLPGPLDGAVAADGVDEFLSVMLPRWAGRNPGRWNGESLHLHRTDGDGEWLVRLGPGDLVESERSHGKADVALRASAASLWLWCTNRGALDALGIDVIGDRAVAEHWSAEVTF
jgi:uncharacterized protein (TIGR03083 family)